MIHMDEALDKMFIKMRKAGRDLVRALTDSMQGEEAFLESMVEYEKTTAEEDGNELSEEDLAKNMKSHKESNPFALNTAGALAQFTEAMRGD